MALTHHDLIAWVDEKQPVATSEIDYRVVAGRSYYAAFHAVDQSYIADQEKFGDAGVHARLINTLKASTDSIERLIGFKLQACKNIRVEADYNLCTEFTRSKLVEVVTKSKAIIKHVTVSTNDSAASNN